MTKRRVLTSEFVDSVVAPTRGERWISDTKLKGFGLRLWGNKNGGGKAFAIRVTDEYGNCVRKTFEKIDYLGWSHSKASLGDYLESARKWARNEIEGLKGRSTEKANLEKASARIASLTLEKAAQSVLRGMRARRLSTAYIDRVDKLFYRYVKLDLRRLALRDVEADDIVDAFIGAGISEGNAQVLRAFLAQIFNRASFFDGTLGRYSQRFSDIFWQRWHDHEKRSFPDIHKLAETDFKHLLNHLAIQEKWWQQALCIRLYFDFHVPMYILMSARWSDVISQRWVWSCLKENVIRFECVVGEIEEVIERILYLIKRDFYSSEYWFPSQFGRTAGHIKTVDKVWRQTLTEVGLPYHRLNTYRDAYRYVSGLPNIWNIRLPPWPCESVAELSKLRDNRRNSSINSDNYAESTARREFSSLEC